MVLKRGTEGSYILSLMVRDILYRPGPIEGSERSVFVGWVPMPCGLIYSAGSRSSGIQNDTVL